jgi:hypothetical protein
VTILKSLADAKIFVDQEIQNTKDLILNTDIELKNLKEKIAEHTKRRKLEKNAATAAATTKAP